MPVKKRYIPKFPNQQFQCRNAIMEHFYDLCKILHPFETICGKVTVNTYADLQEKSGPSASPQIHLCISHASRQVTKDPALFPLGSSLQILVNVNFFSPCILENSD